MAKSKTQAEPPHVAGIEMRYAVSGSRHDTPAADSRASKGDQTQPKWVPDRDHYVKLMSAGFSFFVAGVNDGSFGALIPYVIRTYNVNTAVVSSVYGASFLGWLFAAFANTHLMQYWDLGVMLALGASCQAVAHALRSWKPPLPLFVVTFWLVSVGQAFQDTNANTFVASIKGGKTHRGLAFIHSMYMVGSLVGPFVSTAVASSGNVSRWYLFYTFPSAIGVINLVGVCVAFRDSLRPKGKKDTAARATEQEIVRDDASVPSPSGEGGDRSGEASASRSNASAMELIKGTLRHWSLWILSIYFFFYLGSALTASGWVVEYLVDVRHGELSQMGYVPAGFSGGCLLGRLLLAEPTYRFGERRMILAYCIISVALQLVFWLVPNIIAASIAVSLIGFFTGPLFQTGISLGSKLFPADLQPTALAFMFVAAQMGGSLFPIITGVVSANAGVAVLQPILVSLLTATAVTWMLIPKPKSLAAAVSHMD